jgi:predicted 3-demethylubiquinone-9 3-methyltransferase (glyoxalase superfamily)
MHLPVEPDFSQTTAWQSLARMIANLRKKSATCRLPGLPFDYWVKIAHHPALEPPMPRQKVTPFLWFNTQAEQAARFYVSLFPNSSVLTTTPGPNGQPLVVEFELDRTRFLALNGGPHFQLTEAFSMSVDCADQAEVDRLWELLTDGGSPSQCGWLKDRYGLSWQIVPSILPQMLCDPERGGRVMQALMGMGKIDIRTLEEA